MCLIILVLGGGIALLVTGIVQGQLGMAIFGGVLIAFLVLGLLEFIFGSGIGSDDDDPGEA